MKRPAIISACCLLLAVACAESVEVGTLKPQESSRNVRITVLLKGKALKLARVSFCTVTGAIACFSAYTGNDSRSCTLRGWSELGFVFTYLPSGQSNSVHNGLDPIF